MPVLQSSTGFHMTKPRMKKHIAEGTPDSDLGLRCIGRGLPDIHGATRRA